MSLSKLTTPLLACLLLAICASSAQAYAPMTMGLHDPYADRNVSRFTQMSETHASIARVTVYWSQHVPTGTTEPSGFDARDPASPGYDWTTTDNFVKASVANGMAPLITTLDAPDWAEGDNAADRARRFGDPGTYHVNAKDFGDFMYALAKRYSGKFPDPAAPGTNLPRVKYFQMWNEPNFGQYLTAKTKSEIPVIYLKLLNSGYDAVKSVAKSDLVLSAGLGPYGNNGHATDVEPQLFMRSIMCLTGSGGHDLAVKPNCKTPKPKFDIWTQHPYSFGYKPTSQSGSPDSAIIGDMPDIKATLDFAQKHHELSGSGRKALWISEFGWFSNPPGITAGGTGKQLGLPLSTQAAYLSESVYRTWKAGFSGFIWYGLDDQDAFPTGLFLGKLPDAGPKPALTAFRFPFFADAQGSKVLVWGLVNGSHQKIKVLVEKQSGSSWKKVATVASDGQSMIYKRLTGGKGSYRATALAGPQKGLVSLPFKAR